MEADFQKFVVNLNYGVKSPDWSAHCCHGNRNKQSASMVPCVLSSFTYPPSLVTVAFLVY